MYSKFLNSYRLNVRLKELERQYHISQRWSPTDSEYMQVQHSFSIEKQTYVNEALWAASARRQFLLKLKAKYAGIYSYYVPTANVNYVLQRVKRLPRNFRFK